MLLIAFSVSALVKATAPTKLVDCRSGVAYLMTLGASQRADFHRSTTLFTGEAFASDLGSLTDFAVDEAPRGRFLLIRHQEQKSTIGQGPSILSV